MTTKQADPMALFRFIAEKANATEQEPVALGNVEFWISEPQIVAGVKVSGGDLTYSIPVEQWDKDAMSADANKMTYLVWDELVQYLEENGGMK